MNAFDDLKAEIDANQALNDERWTALLNSDPVKHVKHAKSAGEEPFLWNTNPFGMYNLFSLPLERLLPILVLEVLAIPSNS